MVKPPYPVPDLPDRHDNDVVKALEFIAVLLAGLVVLQLMTLIFIVLLFHAMT